MMDHATGSALDAFERHVKAFTTGAMDFESFRKLRVWRGVYSFRGSAGRYMLRIKIPQGRLDAAQLERLADLAALYSRTGGIHITTRQDVEFHAVEQEHLLTVLRALAQTGLTTWATGGNGVRNITLCPRAGIALDEPFDVTPYANALGAHFAGHPLARGLPRKMKIAFEGCRDDHVRGMIHDIGVYAAVKRGGRGFQIYVGGGLGAAPRSAELLESFTPASRLLPTCDAILTVFHEHGNRGSRDRSRLKFLLQEWGLARFRREVRRQRDVILKLYAWPALAPSEVPPAVSHPNGVNLGDPDDCRYLEWLKRNVIAQKQAGFAAVHVRCHMGDLSSGQMMTLARAADDFCAGRIATTTNQNVLLRWVRFGDLAALHQALEPDGLADCGAERVMDITRCAGADSCLTAVTQARGLATELQRLFANGLAQQPDLLNLTMRVSGCPHACSHHSIADLGFHGVSRTIDGRQVPCYQMLVGGSIQRGQVRFAVPLQIVPARQVPVAVKHLLERYLEHRQTGETFQAFVERTGADALRAELTAFSTLPAHDQAPDLYKDWGSDQDYKVDARKGECYA